MKIARTPSLEADRRPILTDAGLETDLIFNEGFDLPAFASFPLLDSRTGREALSRYYRRFIAMASELGTELVLESPTWRASSSWGRELGYSDGALDDINRRAIEFLHELAVEAFDAGVDTAVSGCIGPMGDGYVLSDRPSIEEAAAYHRPQISTLAEAGADFVSAFTMTNPEEAIGICRAAQAEHIPVVISFTVETDGTLPGGERLDHAIRTVDDHTGSAPLYYMVNCAHPTHFIDRLDRKASWVERIHGVRANASTCSHAELDEATELDDGDPTELAERYRELDSSLPNLTVLGGCCGTDHRHVEAMYHGVIEARASV